MKKTDVLVNSCIENGGCMCCRTARFHHWMFGSCSVENLCALLATVVRVTFNASVDPITRGGEASWGCPAKKKIAHYIRGHAVSCRDPEI